MSACFGVGAWSRADHRSARNERAGGAHTVGSPRICDPRADADDGDLRVDEGGYATCLQRLRRVAHGRGRITDPPGTCEGRRARVRCPADLWIRGRSGTVACSSTSEDMRRISPLRRVAHCRGRIIDPPGTGARGRRRGVPHGSMIRGRMRVNVRLAATRAWMCEVSAALRWVAPGRGRITDPPGTGGWPPPPVVLRGSMIRGGCG